MKRLLSTTALLAALVGGLVLSSCAGVASAPNEEVVLLQAGFQPVLPETVTERNAYESLPAYKVSPTDAPGRPAYAYRDESKKVTYIGGEAEYRRYQQLAQKKGSDEADQLVAQSGQSSTRAMR